VVYPPSVNGQRVNTLKLFGSRKDVLVFGHALGQHKASGVSLAILEVLEVAATDGAPHAPGGRGLVDLEPFGHGLVRRMVLSRSDYDVIDGLHRLAYRLGDGRLDALGYQPGDEIADAGVVCERGNDAAVLVPLARGPV
jgi:hypothetical protein